MEREIRKNGERQRVKREKKRKIEARSERRSRMSSGRRAPKARVCYICGRPTLLPGFENHVSQCRALFEQREALKPPKERRPCPQDPYLSLYSHGGGAEVSKNRKSSAWGDQSVLDDINAATSKAWKDTLSPCKFCGRSFLPEKLIIHNRSCTASNPARSVVAGKGDSLMETSSSRRSSYSGADQYDDFDRSIKSYGANAKSLPAASSFGNRTGSSTLKKTSYDVDSYRDTPTYGHLIKCADCGRNFSEESYAKHSRVCRKVFKTKRKPYDSAKHRVMGTELAAYYNGSKRGRTTSSSVITSSSAVKGRRGSGGEASSSKSNWRQQSRAFRQAVRQAALVSKAERKSKATGVPLHVLLPPSQSLGGKDYSEPDPSYVQCPTCGRSFNEKAGARHIPQVSRRTVHLLIVQLINIALY